MNDEKEFVLVDKKKFMSRFCDISDCDSCPFNLHDDSVCWDEREKFINSLSVTKDFTDDIAKQVKMELLSSMTDLARETRDSIYDKFNKIIEDEHKKIDDEIVKATIYLVSDNGGKIPYGTYDYSSMKEQFKVVDIATKVAKEFKCKYEIQPIKKKDWEQT